ncbi:nacht and ankyrin domain protein [Diaporthe amygdali]|uniref:nacht and ankyrin domain protein n=1 Tax=Phomopsis amygdali TaxID=1214568 RepID=UPI0022FDEE87|nr:nacht and ankyrin domain protein [Diaporthe amygdali]KAJ0122157.1 nacht and ankyrin domain protein [Diaporthe amygdali]
MDPLSIIASLSGVLAFAAQSTRTLTTLITEIRDAPKDISDLRVELESLSMLLQSAQSLTTTYTLRSEDAVIAQTLTQCTTWCQESMQDLRVVISPFAEAGSARRSPMRMLSWIMHKEEVRNSTAKLRDRKASFNLAVTVLNGHLTGKAQDEIRQDIAAGYDRMLGSFINNASARKIRKQLEDDVSSIPEESRRRSTTEQTDAGFAMRKYLENLDIASAPEEAPHTIDTRQVHCISCLDKTPRPLVQAVSAGDKAAVIDLLSKGARVSERAAGGATALHVCAMYDDRGIAEVLIEHGAALDMKNDQRLTPLDVCMQEHSQDVAILLIEKGCRMGNFSNRVLDVLQEAEEDDCRMDAVLEAVAKRYEDTGGGPQLLHVALEREDSNVLVKFLELGFDPNISEDGYRPIHQAVVRDRLEDVKLLIDKGADVNAILPPSALKPRRTEPRHKLIVERCDTRDYTALKLASDSLPMTKLLLSHGADPNVVFPVARDNALNCICAGWYLPVALEIIKHGADVDFQNSNDGCSALYWAVQCANTGLINALLDNGANPNIQTWERNGAFTPLHAAVNSGRYDEAKILVERGADLSIRDSEGLTPLERARQSNSLAMVELLASHTSLDSPRTTAHRIHSGHGRGNR